MKDLRERIQKRLATHKFCYAYENELDAIWPVEESKSERKRKENIKRFAKQNNLEVKIIDLGMRVIFRKRES
jgi:hypothetical protein